MAADNAMTLCGNLTADPELRFTPSGVAVASFTIANTPRTYNKVTSDWEDGETLFLRCNLWRQPAEHLAESCPKGTRVIVTGKLKQRSWEKDGEKRTVMELDVDEVGASVKNATLKINRMSRSSGDTTAGASPTGGGGGRQSTYAQTTPAADPWAAPQADAPPF